MAIQPDEYRTPDGLRQSYSDRWIAGARQRGCDVRIVDVTQPDVVERVRGCDAFLWRSNHGASSKALARRLMPVLDELLEGCVFPDLATFWHYDDKIAQKYLFEAHGIPTPRTWVFWDRDEARRFAGEATFPLVLKLAGGASSENVRLVRSRSEADAFVESLFRGGRRSLRDPGDGAVQPPWKRLLHAVRKPTPDLARGPHWELHKDYVLFQEFLPDNDHDTRVVVVGDRLWAFRRWNRPDDFRASGSGRIDVSPDGIPEDALALCLKAARRLRTSCAAFDVLRSEGRPVIAEVSYAFSQHVPWRENPGHWRVFGGGDAEPVFVYDPEPLRPDDAILDQLLARVAARRGSR